MEVKKLERSHADRLLQPREPRTHRRRISPGRPHQWRPEKSVDGRGRHSRTIQSIESQPSFGAALSRRQSQRRSVRLTQIGQPGRGPLRPRVPSRRPSSSSCGFSTGGRPRTNHGRFRIGGFPRDAESQQWPEGPGRQFCIRLVHRLEKELCSCSRFTSSRWHKCLQRRQSQGRLIPECAPCLHGNSRIGATSKATRKINSHSRVLSIPWCWKTYPRPALLYLVR